MPSLSVHVYEKASIVKGHLIYKSAELDTKLEGKHACNDLAQSNTSAVQLLVSCGSFIGMVMLCAELQESDRKVTWRWPSGFWR